MTGFNLPPGCNVSDLPGNTKADQEREAFNEWLSNIIGDDQTDDFDEISEAIWKAIGKAYADGYAQGASDEHMAAEEVSHNGEGSNENE